MKWKWSIFFKMLAYYMGVTLGTLAVLYAPFLGFRFGILSVVCGSLFCRLSLSIGDEAIEEITRDYYESMWKKNGIH